MAHPNRDRRLEPAGGLFRHHGVGHEHWNAWLAILATLAFGVLIGLLNNPHHAYPVGDRFYLLKRGRLMASLPKDETTIEGLTDLMAGGAELAELSKELMGLTAGAGAPDSELAEVARELAQEAPSPPDGDVPKAL